MTAGYLQSSRVQVVQHSRPHRRGPTARGFQFLIPLGVIVQALVVFGPQVLGRLPGEAAGALLACDLPDHDRQAALRPNRLDDTDRDPNGAGRQSRPVF